MADLQHSIVSVAAAALECATVRILLCSAAPDPNHHDNRNAKSDAAAVKHKIKQQEASVELRKRARVDLLIIG